MLAKTFPEKNILIAKNQPEYIPLPAFASPQGDMTCCFELNEHEMKEALKDGMIFIRRLTFGNRLQPMVKSLLRPNFQLKKGYIDYHTTEVITALAPRTKLNGEVAVAFKLDEKEIAQLKETKQIWITTFTFGTGYQPIVPTTKNPHKNAIQKK